MPRGTWWRNRALTNDQGTQRLPVVRAVVAKPPGDGALRAQIPRGLSSGGRTDQECGDEAGLSRIDETLPADLDPWKRRIARARLHHPSEPSWRLRSRPLSGPGRSLRGAPLWSESASDLGAYIASGLKGHLAHEKLGGAAHLKGSPTPPVFPGVAARGAGRVAQRGGSSRIESRSELSGSPSCASL